MRSLPGTTTMELTIELRLSRPNAALANLSRLPGVASTPAETDGTLETSRREHSSARSPVRATEEQGRDWEEAGIAYNTGVTTMSVAAAPTGHGARKPAGAGDSGARVRSSAAAWLPSAIHRAAVVPK